MHWSVRFAILLLLLGNLLLFPSPAHAAVTLIGFTAQWSDGVMLIEWQTATELDNAGFYVQRSLTIDGGYERISTFIPTMGDPLTGYSYSFIDPNIQEGVVYFYRLEAVDTGNNSHLFDPVSAYAGPPTPTPTATPSPTITETLSPGVTPSATASPTTTPSPTPSVTNTLTPAPTTALTPSPLPSLTPTIPTPPTATSTFPPTRTRTPTRTPLPTKTPTITLTPTNTLIPLGTVTLILPSLTSTLTPTEIPAAISTPLPSPPPDDRRELARLGLIVVIGVLWLLLAGWLVIFFRARKGGL
jgi:hypothetical protein